MTEDLTTLLTKLAAGNCTVIEAAEQIRSLRAQPLGFATVDHDRTSRCGHAEVIFAAGKTPEQVARIAQSVLEHSSVLLVTRATEAQIALLRQTFADLPFEASERSGAVMIGTPPMIPHADTMPIAIVTAGTSDEPVADEAALTCRAHGHAVHRINDVGVAGIHRLLDRVHELRATNVVICIAGMEGALPSVVSGLIDAPVIAVPTSVGYGVAFGGVTALLGMLTSCASGVTVVNIDNGFGAANVASTINRKIIEATRRQPPSE